MTRKMTTLTLAVGVVIGLSLAQLLPAATAATGSAEIITRDDAIVFMVGGQEQGRIDATGLHINGDIAYSGTTIDTVGYAPANDADTKTP